MNILGAIRERARALVRVSPRLLRLALILGNVLGLVGFYRPRPVGSLWPISSIFPWCRSGSLAVGLGFLDRWRLRRHRPRGDPASAWRPCSPAPGGWMGTGAEQAGRLGERRGQPPPLERAVGRILEIRSGRSGESMVDDIIARDPDILVLSEAPPLPGMYAGFQRLPGRRFALSIANHPQDSHAYHFYVLARWPVAPGQRASASSTGGRHGRDRPSRAADPPAGRGRAEQDQPAANPDAPRHRMRLRRMAEKGRSHRPDRGRLQRRQPLDRLRRAEPGGRRISACLAIVPGLEGDMACVLPDLRHRSRLGPTPAGRSWAAGSSPTSGPTTGASGCCAGPPARGDITDEKDGAARNDALYNRSPHAAIPPRPGRTR